MKSKIIYFVAIILSIGASACNVNSTNTSAEAGKEPWTEAELMPPAKLNELLTSQELLSVVVFNIGPSGKIKNSVEIGPTQEQENLENLKKQLSTVSKDKEVVIYCGCCPFKNCPNIRPAFALLKDLNFQKPRLLNLADNLKVDWIDKGYPMME
ncbi:MAG: rhodanese-like domain-containing protein [Bacteroidetes bacterium]|nr:rhodanese-like domain-containing protein [Bacteroidota bacterium]